MFLWVCVSLFLCTYTLSRAHTSCIQTQKTISYSLSWAHTQMHSVCLTHAISLTHRGEMSQPCCMKAPSENQRELKMPNSLGGWSVGPISVVPSSGSSACHSYGLKRLTWDRGGRNTCHRSLRGLERKNEQCRNKTHLVSYYTEWSRERIVFS